MTKRATSVAAILIILCSVISAQKLQMKVTSICNGERLTIDGCDIHDMSDTAALLCRALKIVLCATGWWRIRTRHAVR